MTIDNHSRIERKLRVSETLYFCAREIFSLFLIEGISNSKYCDSYYWVITLFVEIDVEKGRGERGESKGRTIHFCVRNRQTSEVDESSSELLVGIGQESTETRFFPFPFFFLFFSFLSFLLFFPSRTERNGVTNKSEASIEICVRTKIEPSEIRTGEDRKRALTSLVISLSPPQR